MSSRVYIGNLPRDVRERELDDLFYKYGRIRDIDIKSGNGRTFAFVEFDDPRDADDAVRGRDGIDFDGGRIRVELAKSSGRRGGRGGDRDRDRRYAAPSHSDFRVKLSNLPRECSWQDVKDFCRKGCRDGDIGFADIQSGGTAIVEFTNENDMEDALKDLPGAEFTGKDGEVTKIEIERLEGGGGSRGRGRRDDRRGGDDRRRERSRSRDRRDDDRRDDDRRDDRDDRRENDSKEENKGDDDKSAAPADNDESKPSSSDNADSATEAAAEDAEVKGEEADGKDD